MSDDGWWTSDDLHIPLNDFTDMYHLTDYEIITEGASGRIQFHGVRTPSGGFDQISVSEGEVRRWLKSRMPPSVASKVKALGRLAPLKAWRKAYFDNVKFDPENNTIILPDGTRITDVRVSPPKKRRP
jgi:hypothetical protein